MALDCLEKGTKIDQLKVLLQLNGWFELAKFAEECKNYDNVQKMLNHALDLLDRRDITNKAELIQAINDAKDKVYRAEYEI